MWVYTKNGQIFVVMKCSTEYILTCGSVGKQHLMLIFHAIPMLPCVCHPNKRQLQTSTSAWNMQVAPQQGCFTDRLRHPVIEHESPHWAETYPQEMKLRKYSWNHLQYSIYLVLGRIQLSNHPRIRISVQAWGTSTLVLQWMIEPKITPGHERWPISSRMVKSHCNPLRQGSCRSWLIVRSIPAMLKISNIFKNMAMAKYWIPTVKATCKQPKKFISLRIHTKDNQDKIPLERRWLCEVPPRLPRTPKILKDCKLHPLHPPSLT